MQHGFRIRFYLIGDSTVLNMADGGAVGRPCIDVSKDDILVLKGLNYSWTKIADILGISRRTLYRRLEEFNIDSSVFTGMAESDLDELFI